MLKNTLLTAGVAALLLATGCGVSRASDSHPRVLFDPRDDGYPFSEAVQVGDVLYLSGQVGLAADGKSLAEGGIAGETARMMELIGATLKSHGLGFGDIFKCTVMLTDMEEWGAFNAIYAGYFEPGRYPARSAMGVKALALGARVEMECWAYAPRAEGR